jgi:hypothetical protein
LPPLELDGVGEREEGRKCDVVRCGHLGGGAHRQSRREDLRSFLCYAGDFDRVSPAPRAYASPSASEDAVTYPTTISLPFGHWYVLNR